MDPFEDRIRTTLRDRADDVEPTPHLYRQVQRRITRRRRRLAWALAPAGIVVVALLAVPLVTSSGPGMPTITDLAEQPDVLASPTAARQLVTVDSDGATAVLDLADGSVAALASGGVGEPVGAPDLRLPADVRDPSPAAVLGFATSPGVQPGTDPAAAEVVTYQAVRDTIEGRSAIPVEGSPEVAVQPDGGLVVSPDGRWVAVLVAGEEPDAWFLQLAETPPGGQDGVLETLELTLNVPAGSRLQDWTSTGGNGGTRLAVRDPEGRILVFPLRAADGQAPAWVDEQVDVALGGAAVLTYADDHLGGEGRTWIDGGTLHVEGSDGLSGRRDVAALLDGADPASVDLRTWGSTSVLSADTGVWLLAHDGDGAYLDPVALDDVVRAAPVGRDLPPDAEPEQTDEEADDPGTEPPDHAATVTGPLGEGLVVADDTTVALVGSDGAREELYTFPAEGESTIVDVAVRPGSTVDDLTVLITTQAEGMFDLRWLRATDGQATTPQVVEAGPFPLAAADLGVPPTPAWSPEGDLLAVATQPAADGTIELRTLGWDDEGPSTDPNLGATFTLDTDRPWSVTGWVWTDGADGEVARRGQLVLLDPLATTSALLELERQGDGAVALAPDAAPVVRGEGDLALAFGGARGPGGLDAQLVRADDGTVTLRLWRRADAQGGTDADVVEVDVSDLAGPRDGPVLTGWPEGVLVALDPAAPRIVDRASGEISEPPFGGEVVAADALR